MIIRGNSVGHPLSDPRKGLNMTGSINMNLKRLFGVKTPVEADDATNKAYVDAHINNKSNPHGVTAEQVSARPNTWTPSASDVGAAPASHATDKNNPHGVTAAQIGALSNKGHLDHATVLEAAMAMPTTGGTFFAVAGGKLLNTADSAFPGQETVYLMLSDETASAARRTVIAIPYGGGKTVKYRTIWSGAWQTDWKNIASPADIGAATAFELTAIIPASGWFSIAGGSAYENDLDVAGLLGTDKVQVDVLMEDTGWEGIENNILLEEEFAKIYHIPCSDGRLWIRARELPTVDIPIKIKVVR